MMRMNCVPATFTKTAPINHAFVFALTWAWSREYHWLTDRFRDNVAFRSVGLGSLHLKKQSNGAFLVRQTSRRRLK